jgi:hypothetical protein
LRLFGGLGWVQKVVKDLADKPGFLVYDGRKGSYNTDMADSQFCLAPTGSGWGIRIVEDLVAGCLPVIIQVRDNVAMLPGQAVRVVAGLGSLMRHRRAVSDSLLRNTSRRRPVAGATVSICTITSAPSCTSVAIDSILVPPRAAASVHNHPAR